MTGLKGGASCQHRSKKSLINSKAVRGSLKKKVSSCEDCDRLEKNGKGALREDTEVQLCLTCGLIVCNTHAKQHYEAQRTGGPHPFLFNLSKTTIRCHPCDTTLEPLEDNNDPVRLFYNDFKSFSKTKLNAQNRVGPSNEVKSTNGLEIESITVENGDSKSISSSKATENTGLVNNEKGQTVNRNVIPAKGLQNLGNTCFYNSVMQCIMHTHHLQYYFERFSRVHSLCFRDRRKVTVNEDEVVLESASLPITQTDAPLNNNLRGFLAEFRSGTSPGPGTVFAQIAKKAPRFKGWQQQDAHELLRYLMDGLRSEELEWYKHGIANHLGLKTSSNPRKLDAEIVKKAKGYLQAAGRPLLDAVFGGTLLQTIRCSVCTHVSERNEQFLDLSIPISNNNGVNRIGNSSNVLSAHQRKKAQKMNRKNRRRPQPCNNSSLDTTDDLNEDLNGLEISDPSDEEEQSMSTGTRLDFTKVLVSPPNGYSHERSLGACLLEFTAEEVLAGPNAYECENCCSPINKKNGAKGNDKKRVEALKRYLIYEPPVVLTLHLKRFQQLSGATGRLTTRKLGGHVEFPFLFDIAPFCCKNVGRIVPGQKKIVYSLYGVVVHSGDLSGGHYIAYVKSRHRIPNALNFLESARASTVDGLSFPDIEKSVPIPESIESPDGQWYYCSDSRVSAVSESKVLGAEAYILFYERLL
ncbi:unnamed protein product [Auanema sp. JU1783]|nr:unnamed protein product [Auanema sp. JU1783]